MYIQDQDKDQLLTRKEAAEFLRLRPSTLRMWAHTGKYNLPYIKTYGKALYRMSELKKLLEKENIKGKKTSC